MFNFANNWSGMITGIWDPRLKFDIQNMGGLHLPYTRGVVQMLPMKIVNKNL